MTTYEQKYMKYKYKYQNLKQSLKLDRMTDGLQLGGAKCKQMAQYCDVADKLVYIGEFSVTDKIIAGESWNLELNMPKGVYKAYKSYHDLIIVHTSNKNKINKKYLHNKIFNVIGDVGVDGGTFGFYDSGEIYKLTPKKNNTIGGPTMPFFMIPDGKNDSLVTIDALMDFSNHKKENHKKENHKKGNNRKTIFGVQSYTGTGDGFFKCLINKKEGMALLLGHESPHPEHEHGH